MDMMIATIAAASLLLVALLALALEKAYFYVPYKELKRRASQDDAVARALFPAAAYGTSLRVVLLTVVGLSAAGGLLLLGRLAPPVVGYFGIALLLLVTAIWIMLVRPNMFIAQIAIWCTPPLVWLMRVAHPVTQHISPLLQQRQSSHTGVFERQDLYEFIERQKQQEDSRIAHEDLERMRCVLYMADYHVRDIVVPRREVKAVSLDDDLSPVLISELHATGHACFPVYDGKVTNVVGTLFIDRVADVKQHGAVRDNYDHHLAYVNEEDTLEQVLRAFYETRQHLFVVVNKHDEYIGIITLSDILYRVFGTVDHHAFGHSEDRKAVASRYDHKEHAPNPAEHEETTSTNTTEVVE